MKDRDTFSEGLNALSDVARFATLRESPDSGNTMRDWVHAGLRCKALQGPFGINGYVAVPKSHPNFGDDYDDVDVEVHGGLTFGQQGEEDSDMWPDPELYWFGWDTAHGFSGHWDLENVVVENEKLAEQLSRLSTQTARDES